MNPHKRFDWNYYHVCSWKISSSKDSFDNFQSQCWNVPWSRSLGKISNAYIYRCWLDGALGQSNSEPDLAIQSAQKQFQIAFAIIVDIIDNIAICANGCNPGDDEADGCEKCKRITFEFSIFFGQYKLTRKQNESHAE